jgi:hypothetical protein
MLNLAEAGREPPLLFYIGKVFHVTGFTVVLYHFLTCCKVSKCTFVFLGFWAHLILFPVQKTIWLVISANTM